MSSYAIIQTGGKQYKVSPGDLVQVELLKAPEGEEVVFEKVLMVKEGDQVKIGNPVLEGFSVRGRLLKNSKAKKVLAFKYKRRKGYKRLRGHRQWYSTVKIQEITGS